MLNRDTSTTISYEEILEQQGFFVFTNIGCSMLPLLRQKRDLMVIYALPKPDSHTMRAQRYDAVLFKHRGKYILHRVLRAHKDGTYTICGDHCFRCEKSILDSQLLGVLTEVQRDGNTVYVDMNKKRRGKKIPSLKYRLFVHLICDLFPIRCFVLAMRYYAGVCMGKILRMTQIRKLYRLRHKNK